jgi:hypothetical protein
MLDGNPGRCDVIRAVKNGLPFGYSLTKFLILGKKQDQEKL